MVLGLAYWSAIPHKQGAFACPHVMGWSRIRGILNVIRQCRGAMGNFFAELRRRHIYRIGAGYVVVAWGIAQVLDVLSQLFALPDWIAQPAVIALAIGLPIILIAAWMIVGAANETDSSADRLKATTVDYALFGAMAVVIGLIGYQQLSTNNTEIALTTGQENTAAANIAGEIVEAVSDRLPNWVAVLPFENVSPDPDDAYFAIGIHEEILNKLNRLRNVSVIGR